MVRGSNVCVGGGVGCLRLIPLLLRLLLLGILSQAETSNANRHNLMLTDIT